MKIVFDLDYTLFDTKKFKDKLAEIFAPENFIEDYRVYFKNRKINFSLNVYIALLKERGRTDDESVKELKLKLKEIMLGLDNYLFAGAEAILKHLKAGGAELILLTFGDKKWQAEKVNNLNIKNYFKKISFEDRDKTRSKLLKSLKSSQDEVLIVNDNAQEAKAMAEVVGKKAKVFLVAGPYSNNIKHNWPIHKLDELII